jgi:hypothetical protein
MTCDIACLTKMPSVDTLLKLWPRARAVLALQRAQARGPKDLLAKQIPQIRFSARLEQPAPAHGSREGVARATAHRCHVVRRLRLPTPMAKTISRGSRWSKQSMMARRSGARFPHVRHSRRSSRERIPLRCTDRARAFERAICDHRRLRVARGCTRPIS